MNFMKIQSHLEKKGKLKTDFFFDTSNFSDKNSLMQLLRDIYIYYGKSRTITINEEFKDEENKEININWVKSKSKEIEESHKPQDQLKIKIKNQATSEYSRNIFKDNYLQAQTMKSKSSTKLNTTNDCVAKANRYKWIYEWFKSINFTEGTLIDYNSTVINEFKDGFILSKLLSRLEDITLDCFLTSRSKKCKANIASCLQFLKQKPDFPFDFLYFEEEISSGHGEIIRGLLKNMYQYYNRNK